VVRRSPLRPFHSSTVVHDFQIENSSSVDSVALQLREYDEFNGDLPTRTNRFD
jgi:hypothetical protein